MMLQGGRVRGAEVDATALYGGERVRGAAVWGLEKASIKKR